MPAWIQEELKAGCKMNKEREIVEQLWPQHAEACSDDDWRLLEHSVASNANTLPPTVDPSSTAKDLLLTSLMIIFWTMKIVHAAFEISRSLRGLEGRARVEAIVAEVNKRLSNTTPQAVRDRIVEIVTAATP